MNILTSHVKRYFTDMIKYISQKGSLQVKELGRRVRKEMLTEEVKVMRFQEGGGRNPEA